ncbi:MAG: hypothetical protein HYY93_12305 [Planctomycetes bacterium]|nr:hypothetical protein [Planctomycetota bacterium]
MRRTIVVLALFLAPLAAGCFKERIGWGYTGNDPARYGGQRIYSPHVDQPPRVDGDRDDGAWRRAPAVEIAAQGPSPGRKGVFNPRYTVQSVHTDTHVYFAVSWRDLSDRASGKARAANFIAPPSPAGECAMAVGFPLSDSSARLQGRWDLWRWAAHPLEGGGSAGDLTCRFFHSAIPDPALTVPLATGGVQAELVSDSEIAPGWAASGRDSCEPPPEGEAGSCDVEAAGSWSCGRWIVEFARPRRTPDAVDVAIDPDHPVPLALIHFDRKGKIRRVSHDLWLVLEPGGHARDPRGGR